MDMSKAEVCIIGAGFSGLYLASRISSQFKVKVLDLKSEIGKPQHCAGIVSSRVVNALGNIVSEHIEGKFRKLVVLDIDRGSEVLHIKLSEPIFRIDREGIERSLAEISIAQETSINLRSRAVKINGNTVISTKDRICADLIVVAEGAVQKLTRSLGLGYTQDRVLGLQQFLRVQHLNLDENSVYVLVSDTFDKDCFGWLVPLRPHVLIGVMTRQHNGKEMLRHVEKLCGKLGIISVSSRGNIFGGTILRGPPLRRVSREYTLVIGDASGFVKPISGGGLYWIVRQVDILSNSVRITSDLSEVPKIYSMGIQRYYFKLKIDRYVHLLLKSIGYSKIVKVIGALLRQFPIAEYDEHSMNLLRIHKFVIKSSQLKFSQRS